MYTTHCPFFPTPESSTSNGLSHKQKPQVPIGHEQTARCAGNDRNQVDTRRWGALNTIELPNGPLPDVHAQLRDSANVWQPCAAVDEQGWARIRRHPTHKQKLTPTYIVLLQYAKGLQPDQRLFPLRLQAPTTPRPPTPEPPPYWLAQDVKSNLQTWNYCIAPPARIRLQKAV